MIKISNDLCKTIKKQHENKNNLYKKFKFMRLIRNIRTQLTETGDAEVFYNLDWHYFDGFDQKEYNNLKKVGLLFKNRGFKVSLDPIDDEVCMRISVQ